MMNEAARRTVSEDGLPKSSGRKGGALLGLFDWTRRSSSKKSATRSANGVVSTKPGDADKMPLAKFLMIAEENFGSYPSKKVLPEVNQSRIVDHGGQSNKERFSSPTIVARLMGLEPLPSLSRGAPQKGAYSDSNCKAYEPVDTNTRFGEYGKLSRGLELKEQVISGTSSRESRIKKSVPSDARRQSRKTTNSLTKTIDPLPSSNSSNATVSNTEIVNLKKQLRERARSAMPHTLAERSGNDKDNSPLENTRKQVSASGKTCKGWQHSVDNITVGLEEPVVIQVLHESKRKSSVYSQMERHPGVASQFQSCLKNKSSVSERNLLPGNDQCQSRWRDEADLRQPDTLGSKSMSWDQMPSRNVVANTCSVHRRDSRSSNSLESYVALSRNRKSCNRESMVPESMSRSRVEKESNWDERRFAREKKQNFDCHTDNRYIADLNLPKKTDAFIHNNVHATKVTKPCLSISNATSHNSPQNEIARQAGGNNVAQSKDLRVVSSMPSTFDSNAHGFPLSFKNIGNKRSQLELLYDNSRWTEKSEMGVDIENLPSQRVMALSGDKLGALLEQKIMELKCLDQDDIDASDDVGVCLGRSSASILEELISALTNGQTVSNGNPDSYKDDLGLLDVHCDGPVISSLAYEERITRMLQAEKAVCTSSDFSVESDYYGPSPVSILEASFSTESCMSENISTDSETNPYSAIKSLKSFDPDMGAVDSSDSCRPEVLPERASYILDSMSIMYSISPGEIGVVENKPTNARDVILNTNLLFGDIKLCKSSGLTASSVDSILLDSLEILVEAFQSNLSCSERSQNRRFLFDCMIEHLDLKCGRLLKSDYKTWMLLSQFLTSEKLAMEVSTNVNEWMILGGRGLDLIMSKEVRQLSMNHTAFDIEVYELGVEIGHAILDGMISETLMDILTM